MNGADRDKALQLTRDLRSTATRIDGWCSSCHELDKHRDWCPWTQLLAILERQTDESERIAQLENAVRMVASKGQPFGWPSEDHAFYTAEEAKAALRKALEAAR